jgi:nucleotide-binding universal stress UspA family protein
MYQRIAVPLDGSELAYNALGPARRIAAVHGASLMLVVVATADVPDPAAVVEEAERRIGSPTHSLIIPHDNAAEALGDFDAADPRTLICMTTKGKGALRRALLGSTALSVVEHSPHAVVLIGPHCDLNSTAPIEHVVICVDGTPEAEVIIPWAMAWATTTATAILLLKVVYPVGQPGASDPPSRSFIAELNYLSDLTQRLEVAGTELRQITLAHQNPSDAIHETTANYHDALIAVTTSHPSRLTELLEGSTAADVIRRASTPVLIASQHGTIAPPPLADVT